MLGIFKSKLSVFNYEDIPPGYYHKKMYEGSAAQRYWHRQKFAAVARLIPSGSEILDIGCGPGSFLDVLGDIDPNGRGVGIDVANPQIEYAKEEIATKYDGRIRFQHIIEDEGRLPFPDQSFDYVTSIEVIEHIHPFIAIQMLSEARRVLKPNGKLLVTTPNYHSFWPAIEFLLNKVSPVSYHDQHINKFTPNSLVKFLESGGYEVGRINTIFCVAPFLAPLSWGVAEWAQKIEQKLLNRVGSLMIVECEKLNFDFRTAEEAPPRLTG